MTIKRGALFLLDVEGIGVDMEEFRYSDHYWFREQPLTNERRALLHLYGGGHRREFRYGNHHWFREQPLTNDRRAILHLNNGLHQSKHGGAQVWQSPSVQGATLDQWQAILHLDDGVHRRRHGGVQVQRLPLVQGAKPRPMRGWLSCTWTWRASA